MPIDTSRLPSNAAIDELKKGVVEVNEFVAGMTEHLMAMDSQVAQKQQELKEAGQKMAAWNAGFGCLSLCQSLMAMKTAKSRRSTALFSMVTNGIQTGLALWQQK